MLAVFLAGLAWAIRRVTASQRTVLLILAAGLLLTLGLAACTGRGAVNPGTPAGAYTLTVTGSTALGTATVSHSIPLTLTVQ
jgi:hypothetical protein